MVSDLIQKKEAALTHTRPVSLTESQRRQATCLKIICMGHLFSHNTPVQDKEIATFSKIKTCSRSELKPLEDTTDNSPTCSTMSKTVF